MKKHHVVWTKTALSDLEAVIDYIPSENTATAIDIFKNIKNKTNALNKHPHQGRIIPELEKHNIINYRELIIYPWRIIYRVEQSNVYILAVIDGRRNLEDILLNRLMRE